MKHTVGLFFLRIFSVILFFVVTAVTLFFAYGYQFDVESRNVQKTSIIDIAAPETNASVYLDGEDVAEKIPAQLKNVLPGSHDVIVQKEGFISWSRPVEVKEDLVSIVRDVLLVPSNVGEYVTPMFIVDEPQIVHGNGYLLSYEPDTEIIRSFVFHDKGIITDNVISFFTDSFSVVDSFSDKALLLRFLSGVYAYVDLETSSYYLFTLPEDFQSLVVDMSSKSVFFLHDGNLFMDSFDDSGIDEGNAQSFGPETSNLVFADVSEFIVHEKSSHIFLISMGMIYRLEMGASGAERLLDNVPASIDGIMLLEGNDYDVLVLQGEDRRQLLWVDTDGDFHEIDGNISGVPLLDGSSRVLYQKNERELYSYNIEKDALRFIKIFEPEYKILGWFDDVGHFLYSNGSHLVVSDIFSSHDVVLLEEFDPASFIHAQDGAVFWLNEERLMRLYWNDIF